MEPYTSNAAKVYSDLCDVPLNLQACLPADRVTGDCSCKRDSSIECSCIGETFTMGPKLAESILKKAKRGQSSQGLDVLPTKRKQRLGSNEYEIMLNYVEDPENFMQLSGSGRNNGPGKCVTKATAFVIMAAQISGKNGFPQCTGDELQKRFQRYINMYKKAVDVMKSTGGGLTEAEIVKGITLVEKLNKLCPHFDRMHALYGERANMNPPAVASLGLPTDVEILGYDSQPAPTSFTADVNEDSNEEDGEEDQSYQVGSVLLEENIENQSFVPDHSLCQDADSERPQDDIRFEPECASSIHVLFESRNGNPTPPSSLDGQRVAHTRDAHVTSSEIRGSGSQKKC